MRQSIDACAWHTPCSPPGSMKTAGNPMSSSRALRTLSYSTLSALALCALLGAPTHAAPVRAITSTRAIGEAAERAILSLAGASGAQLTLAVAPMDPRLRLPACDAPLQSFLTADGQVRHQTTVGVRCDGTVRWTIYTSVTVDSLAPVLVARYALPRDAMLTAADFDLQKRR